VLVHFLFNEKAHHFQRNRFFYVTYFSALSSKVFQVLPWKPAVYCWGSGRQLRYEFAIDNYIL